MLKTALTAAAALALGTAAAAAHIVLETKETPVGASYKASLRVTHGCDGAATTGLRVTLPEGFIGAKPMPKPGWRIEVKKGAYNRSYGYYHGDLKEGAVEIVWSGGDLPDDFVDDFSFIGFVARELKASQSLHFPVVQECAGGRSTEWVEIPKDGAGLVSRPAPGVRLTLKPTEFQRH